MLVQVLLVAITSLVRISNVQGPPAPTELPPPAALCEGTWSVRIASTFGANLMVRASASTEAKQVTIVWSYWPAYPQPVGRSEESQVFQVGFWPTAIAAPIDNAICVGGRRADGKTVVQVWQFGPPSLSVNGEIVPGTRTSVTTLYDEETTGRDIAVNMCRYGPAASQEMLIQFYDSQDIWSINVVTGTMTWRASNGPDIPPNGIVVPELTIPRTGITRRNHSQHGLVYILIDGDYKLPGSKSRILRDVDRDGNLDDYIEVDEAAWEAQGFADKANYLED